MRRNRKGFTLLETLVTVAVLLLVSSIAVLGVGGIVRSIRQTRLDATAQILYVAAQNRLTELRTSGRGDIYQENVAAGISRLGYRPADAEESMDENSLLYYSTDTAESYLAQLLPASYVDDEIENGYWVVEYAPASGEVYAVFFSETETVASFYRGRSQDDAYRESRNARISLGAKVGYYGGGGVSVDSALGTYTLSPQITVINGEKLQLRLYCLIPEDLAGEPDRELTFHVTLTDEGGHQYTYSNLIPDEWGRLTRTRSYLLTLDAMEDGQHFYQRAPGLTPGDNITAELRVTCQSSRVSEARTSAIANSLFDNGSVGDCALLRCGRHLQNLDWNTSYVKNSICNALQTEDIYFSDKTADDQDWYSTYCQSGVLHFKPIQNDNIESLEAQNDSVIYGLSVAASGDAGLFSAFRGSEIRNVQLSGASVSGSDNVGGLAGRVTSGTQIIGCGVFLSEEDVDGLDESHVWISGSTTAAEYTGGLVGYAEGNLQISDSFAASVISGSGYVGGLVGGVAGELQLNNSYGDCYLSGRVAGGIAAACSNNSVISSCYFAGFITAVDSAAGLVPAAVKAVRNAYTAAELSGAACLRTVESATTTENLYYLAGMAGEGPGAGKSTAELSDLPAMLGALGGASGGFSGASNTNRSFPYNLKADMALRTYPYPRLDALRHYGDWPASFLSGALVYFERYEDGSWGFSGGNVSTLAESDSAHYTLEGGYALLFDAAPTSNVSISWQTDDAGSESSLDLGTTVETLTVGGKAYYLMKLPEEIQGSSFVASKFYRKLTALGSSFWFNPHFANTVVPGETMPELAVAGGNLVLIRTARQLFNLSLYYDAYREQTETCIFQQQLDLDYGEYEWPTGLFTGQQKPIGSSESTAFRAIYDGMYHEIRGGVSFYTADDYYGGLFGCNSGTLRNVVLAAEYTMTNYQTVGCAFPHRFGGTAYVGTLAGRNSGMVENCAVAGYVMDANAYNGAMVYLGGLVGYNDGTIRSSSASTPHISLECTYADGQSGGFVGTNHGAVSNSYAFAYVHARQFKTCQISMGGFAGNNSGSITASYCATALFAEGEMSAYGFTSATGAVNRCYYLDGGAYRYVGSIQAYHNDQGRGLPLASSELEALSLGGFGRVASAPGKYHIYTGIDEAFPYPGSVKGADGQYIHYGEWITPAGLGELGMIYWERETGGSNAGYHFSILPVNSGIEAGSTLCEAHDDGGVIDEFGYAYYVLQAPDHSGDEFWGLSNIVWQDITHGERNTQAETELARQLNGLYGKYSFFAYTTGTAGMYLNSAAAEGGLHLEYEGTGYDFRVCPFFADAMTLASASVHAGAEGKPYQVRSVSQLQYINWNSSEDNTTTSVDDVNYKQFPYLYAADSTSRAQQAKKPINAYWVQTHDISGAGVMGYVPIADAATTSSPDSYNAVLYAWFGGSYDGQSYKIQNLNINSQNYSVGLFGVTAGAELRNIILYSDGGNVIQRSGDENGAYAIGGLVGVAYDYSDPSGNSIENCAIAGYSVQDNSTGKQTLGEANVGGLIGVANVDLHNCSSVVELQINCTHESGHAKYGDFIRVGGVAGANKNVMTNCYSGGTVIVGADTLSESRNDSGNKVTADQSRNSDENLVDTKTSTHVFIGGIAGSGFTSNYQNFSGTNGSNDGKPHFENCYTYMDFPEFGGSIRGICIIGGVADRYAFARSSSVNCYYLNTVSGLSLPEGYLEYRFVSNSTSDTNVGPNFQNMLRGNMDHFRRWITGGTDSTTFTEINLTALNYAQMSDFTSQDGLLYRINGGSFSGSFTPVTTQEHGIQIDGKYSFSCGDAWLEGRNYPFPTIIKQAEGDEEVSVHYGRWPKDSGLFLDEKFLRLDLLSTQEGEAEYEAVLKLQAIQDNELLEINPAYLSIVYDDEILDVSLGARVDAAEGFYYPLSVRGLKRGGNTVTLRYAVPGDETLETELSVTVTAIMNLEAFERSGDVLFTGDTKVWELQVLDRNGNIISTNISNWQVSSDNTDIARPAIYLEAGELLLRAQAFDPGDAILSVRCVGIPVKDPANAARVDSDILILEMNVQEPGTIGLANSAERKYQEFSILNTVGEVQDDFSGAEEPAMSGSVLLLYASSEALFSQWEVMDARISDDSVYPYDPYNRSYSVRIGAEPVKSGRYYCLAVSVETAMIGSDVRLALQLRSRSDSSITRVLEVPYRLPSEPSTYLVRYWSVPNELLDTEEVDYGGSAKGVTLGSSPLRVGYTYNGYWYTDPSGSQLYVFGKEPVYDDLDLYAGWDANQYTVSFDLNYEGAGTAPASKTVTFDSAFGTLHAPTRTGYAFLGWYTAATDGEKITADSILTTPSDLTLYAHWTEVHYYRVTFKNGTETVGTCYACPELNKFFAVANDGSAELKVMSELAVTEDGRILEGYYYNGIRVADASGNLAPVASEITGDVTAEAVWTPKLNLQIGSDLYLSGKIAEGQTAITWNTTYAKPTGGNTGDGYTFLGWYSTRNATGVQVLDKDGKLVPGVSDYTDEDGKWLRDAETTLYARWKRVRTAYVDAEKLGFGGTYVIYNGSRALSTSSEGSVSAVAITPQELSGYALLDDNSSTAAYSIDGLSSAEVWEYTAQGYLKNSSYYLYVNGNNLRISTGVTNDADYKWSSSNSSVYSEYANGWWTSYRHLRYNNGSFGIATSYSTDYNTGAVALYRQTEVYCYVYDYE